jgi:hypothetical protein
VDITSYVTSVATMLSQSKVNQQVNISLLKTAMSSAENQSTELLKAMEISVQPHIGGKIDIKG